MTVSPWLRLWLPMGSCLLVVAALETVTLTRNGLKDMGIIIYEALTTHPMDDLDFYNQAEIYFFGIAIGIRLIATIGLLWIGAIFKGHKYSFLTWIVITVLINTAIFILLIIYTVGSPPSVDSFRSWWTTYSILIFVLGVAYTLFITITSYRMMSRQEDLHPTGKGLVFIWEYFSNETKVAALFFLTSEIILDVEYLLSRQFARFFQVSFYGHDSSPEMSIVVEEIILRVVRVLMNAIGIWLVQGDKRRIFKYWCALTFTLIMVSTIIFIVVTVQWRGENISVSLAYFLLFPCHLLYRFITLYFCLKYTRADFSNFLL